MEEGDGVKVGDERVEVVGSVGREGRDDAKGWEGLEVFGAFAAKRRCGEREFGYERGLLGRHTIQSRVHLS